ncbi:TetR/AcrR family transcriptional regulator [Streptomyces sp. NPDC002785]|uniref:TetR/AcrR family transcriptional regulator n=1 Tax=Streptomyces sp. NPDC002785 TaxID=3154543 RepID=UPI00332F0DA1
MITSPSSLRRSERSRRATLEAALELCTEKGYGRVTIEAIAARAGVSKKTIYRWWPSKSAVMLEAFTDALVGTIPFVDTGDIAADLRANVMGAVKLLSTPPYGPAYAGILSEVHHDDVLAETVRTKLVDPRFGEAVDRLRRAQEQGQIPPDADLPLAVEMLYAPVYYRTVLRKPVQDEGTIAALVAHVLRALGVPDAPEVPEVPEVLPPEGGNG